MTKLIYFLSIGSHVTWWLLFSILFYEFDSSELSVFSFSSQKHGIKYPNHNINNYLIISKTFNFLRNYYYNQILIFPFSLISIKQAIACYTPKFLWDAFEGGLLRTIVMGLNIGICREEEKVAKKRELMKYLTMHLKVCPYSYIYNN